MAKKIIINTRQLNEVLNVNETFLGYFNPTNVNGDEEMDTIVDGRVEHGTDTSAPVTTDRYVSSLAKKSNPWNMGNRGLRQGLTSMVEEEIEELDEINQALQGEAIPVIDTHNGTLKFSDSEKNIDERKRRLKQRIQQGDGSVADERELYDLTTALDNARGRVKRNKEYAAKNGQSNAFIQQHTKQSGNGEAHTKKGPNINYFA